MKALLLAAAAAAAAPSLEPVEGPGLAVSLRYAAADNIAGRDLYGPLGVDRCYVLPELRRAVVKAAESLSAQGLTLVLWDCWRPVEAHEALWKAVPDPKWVGDPKKGSHHSRGAAVDATLARDGRELEMPTQFDAFVPAAGANWPCPKARAAACRNRAVLRKAMTEAGLQPYEGEWWHFSLPGASKRRVVAAP